MSYLTPTELREILGALFPGLRAPQQYLSLAHALNMSPRSVREWCMGNRQQTRRADKAIRKLAGLPVAVNEVNYLTPEITESLQQLIVDGEPISGQVAIARHARRLLGLAEIGQRGLIRWFSATLLPLLLADGAVMKLGRSWRTSEYRLERSLQLNFSRSQGVYRLKLEALRKYIIPPQRGVYRIKTTAATWRYYRGVATRRATQCLFVSKLTPLPSPGDGCEATTETSEPARCGKSSDDSSQSPG
jgi:hypothetical protein